MTRLALLLVVALGFGCSKPSEADCRKAIGNMQRLMGTENLIDESRVESEVRRCKGGSKKAAVDCAIKAQTLDDLRHCDFFKVPANAPIGTDPGSAAGSAGSAGSATGSAGSATTGSAAGSDTTGSAAGSATGSGSGATAAGTGSASGSAATGSATTPSGAVGSAAPTPAVGSAK